MDYSDTQRLDQLEQKNAELERLIQELASRQVSTVDDAGAFGPKLALSQHNPLFNRGAGRVVIQIPFDDSIDGSNALECFFQMPTQVRAIRSAKVWVQRKSFRTYTSAAQNEGAHTHSITQGDVTSGQNDGGTTDAQGLHNHTDPQGGTTGDSITHSHNLNVASPGYHHHSYVKCTTGATNAGSNHNHTLTSGIFETAASGTLSLFVSNDGTNYGSAITSGATAITGVEIKEQLRAAAGDRRVKITGTSLMRVQVLIVLDLRVAVLG